MAIWQAFVLGVMVAYTPSIIWLALMLHHENLGDDRLTRG